MQDRTFDELKGRTMSDVGERYSDAVSKLQAEISAEKHVEQLREEGKVLLMSDEEERMVRALRAFKDRLKVGSHGLFKWNTYKAAAPEGISDGGDLRLIADPQEDLPEAVHLKGGGIGPGDGE